MCKLGTMPQARMWVCRKRKLPVLGQTFEVKERRERTSRPQLVVCDEVQQMPSGYALYRLSLV